MTNVDVRRTGFGIRAQRLQPKASIMRRLAALGVLLAIGCKSSLLESGGADLATTADLTIEAPDFAVRDLTSSDLAGRVPCGVVSGSGADQTCDGATEACVFIERGDCSGWVCRPLPPACRADRSCACLGSAACPSVSDVLTCKPRIDPGEAPADFVCQSASPCI